MSEFEVLVLKFSSVNTLSASAISSCEISPLAHKLWNDPVEVTALHTTNRLSQ